MTLKPARLTAASLVVYLLVMGGSAMAQPSGCTLGLSAVACPATTRTIVVAQTGTATYRSIQPALDAARPGDTIVVRAGTYTEPLMMRVSGTPVAPITLRAYAGERPIIQPFYEGRTATVALSASWLILDGFEIRKGRHGVVISGPNNIVRNNYVHDNGTGCASGELCGQGVIVSSTTDAAIVDNRIERNGLTGSSPWHLHGVYLSNFTGQPVARVSVINNTIREHSGAGFQAWDPTAPIADVLLQGNRFENNVIDAIISNVANGTLKSNTFVHTGTHPATDAPRSTMLWFELSRNIAIEGNTFQYRAVTAYGVPTMPLHWYATDQNLQQLRWRANTWDAPGLGVTITDALLTVAPASTVPMRPMLMAEQSAANPVTLNWLAGAGVSPTDYTLVVGSTPGQADVAVLAMGATTSIAATAPAGTPLYARMIGRNAGGTVTSNEVRLHVMAQTPVPPAAPVMNAPSITGTTVRLSWQASGTVTGYTILARYAPGAGIIASIPVAASPASVTLTGVARGTYYVSIVAVNGSLNSVESNLATVTVQ